MEIIIQIIIIIFTVKEDGKERAVGSFPGSGSQGSSSPHWPITPEPASLALKSSSSSGLPPRGVGLTAAAWAGAKVAVGILPSVGTEATGTSHPEQNELNAKLKMKKVFFSLLFSFLFFLSFLNFFFFK